MEYIFFSTFFIGIVFGIILGILLVLPAHMDRDSGLRKRRLESFINFCTDCVVGFILSFFLGAIYEGFFEALTGYGVGLIVGLPPGILFRYLSNKDESGNLKLLTIFHKRIITIQFSCKLLTIFHKRIITIQL